MKNYCWLVGLGLLISLVTPNSAAGYDEQVAYFCSTCTSDAAARQKAQTAYAPPLVCDYGNPPTYPPPGGCQETVRRVILGNHLTGQVFAYLVKRNDTGTINLIGESPLSSIELDLYDSIIEFRNEWEDILAQGFDVGDLGINSSLHIFHERLSSECPDGTALEVATDPNALASFKNKIRLQMEAVLAGRLANQPRVSGGQVGATVSRGSVSLSGALNIEQPVPAGVNGLAIRFPINEVGTNDDLLSFNIELVATTVFGDPAFSIELEPSGSWVDGASLSDLMSGAVIIDNDCIIDKLANVPGADWQPEPPQPIGAPGDGGGGGGGGGPSFCVKTYRMYVMGQFQGTFRVLTLCP